MAEEMIMESFPMDAYDGEDIESDEAIAEAEDAEDSGEAFRRRRARRSRYRPGRGVHGLKIRGNDGMLRNLQFPTKLATAEETNRGLANLEVGRRALEKRLDDVETRGRVQQKRDTTVGGIVALTIGGGLTAWGAINAAKKPAGQRLSAWAKDDLTRMATVASVSQIVTSGAKLAISGKTQRSGVGTAADIFAVAQLATFAFASLYKPGKTVRRLAAVDAAELAAIAADPNSAEGDEIYQVDNDTRHVLFALRAGGLRAVELP